VQLVWLKKIEMITKIKNNQFYRLILTNVYNHYGLDLSFVENKSRKTHILIPRQISIYLILKYTTLSQENVVNIFGLSNHTTAQNSRKRIESLKHSDKLFRQELKSIENKIIKNQAKIQSFDTNKVITLTNFTELERQKLKAAIELIVGSKIDSHLYQNTEMYVIEEN
jgi:hypothetical protein